MRLVLPALAAWVTAFGLLGATAVVALVAAGATVLAAAFLVFGRRRRHWVNVTAASLAGASAAAAAVGFRLAAVDAGPLPDLAEERAAATIDAVLTSDPKLRQDARHGTLVMPARAERVEARGRSAAVRSPVLLIVPRSASAARAWTALLPSQRVRVFCDLAPPRYGRALTAVAFCREAPRAIGGPSEIQELAAALRAGLRSAVEPLAREPRGVLPALVVGDTSLLVPELEDDFRTTGLTHLLVVSGANVAIVLGAVLAVARWVGIGARSAPLFGGVAVLGFAIVARPEPSVLRATAMGLITVVALATGRERRALPALAAAVLGLVLFNPALARSYGFALSVLATGGLLVLAPGWSDRLARRLPRSLAEALAIPAAAQVAVAPLLATLSGEVSLVAVAANMVAAPAVAPATVVGLLAAVTAQLHLPLAQALAAVGGVAVGWIVQVAHVGAAVPFASLPWPGGAIGAVALILAIALGAVLLAHTTGRRIVAGCVAGAVVGAFALHALAPGWPPRGWLLAACDVGQGDALVLAAAPGSAVVVDAGPQPRLVDRCLRRLGVRQVPLLVLTHLHADHVDGLSGVLRGRRVDAAVVGGAPDPASRVERRLDEAGVNVHRARAGQRWRVGALDVSVLWPPGRPEPHGIPDAASSEDEEGRENNASVVLRARWGRITALLPGDIETETQRTLAATANVDADIVKVPHHGSSRFDPGFLRAVGARLAVTSVGADNPYGHPSHSVLRLLRETGARSLRTDRDGAVAVVRGRHGLAAVPRGGPGGN